MAKIHLNVKDKRFLSELASGNHARKGLLASLGISESAFQKRTAKLMKLGLVINPRYGVYIPTKEGKNEAETFSSPIKLTYENKRVEKFIKKLPTEPHQALFQLMLDAYIAKKALFDEFDDNWPAFIITGKTGSFKSKYATAFCRVVGENPDKCIIPLQNFTAKGLGVRHVKDTKKPGYISIPSILFGYHFACLDNLEDVKDKQVKRAALFILDGRREFPVEGGMVQNKTIGLVCLNLKRGEKLSNKDIPESYMRRSVIVNTNYINFPAQKLYLIVGDILDNPIPRITTDHLEVNFKQLKRENKEFLGQLLYEGVKKEEEDLVNVKRVEILILGHLIRSGGDDIKTAIFEEVFYRLICLESIGAAKEGWRKVLMQRWAKYTGERKPEFEKKQIEAKKEKERIDEEIEQGREKIVKAEDSKREKRHFIVQGLVSEEVKLKQIRSDFKQLGSSSNKRDLKPILAAITDELEYIHKGKKTEKKLEESKRIIHNWKDKLELYRIIVQQRQEETKREEGQRKEYPSLKILKKLIQECMERKKILPHDNIIEKLESVECIYKRMAIKGAISPFLELSLRKGINELPPIFSYYEGVDGEVYLPDDLNSWDKARPLLVRRLQQLEQGKEEEKVILKEKRLKDMVDCVLKNKEKWPDWFKKEHEKITKQEINFILENSKQWPEWFRAFFFKFLNKKVDQRLNKEFQTRVSTEVAKEVQRLKTILFPQYINPKVSELTGKIQENVFKALNTTWRGIPCPKCHGEIEVTLREEEVKKLLKAGKVLVKCPFPNCQDFFGYPYTFSIKLEDLIRTYLTAQIEPNQGSNNFPWLRRPS